MTLDRPNNPHDLNRYVCRIGLCFITPCSEKRKEGFGKMIEMIITNILLVSAIGIVVYLIVQNHNEEKVK